ncbi:MAG: NADH-quinone oxidoreductase subunit H [Candidatus Falkowbacteria bacterium]|nr:NADH-quinone oxidoreductase subunit H [Candidatus Falkowbacteria bacterium]
MALAGIDVGGGFGGFGSSREMMMASLTEAGLVLSLLTLALISKSTNLFDISSNIANLPFSEFAPVALAFISFFISMLAETCRYPFDNPATHLELTMIHEAMILEYSGKRLALVEWASANKYLIFMSLGINLFFPQHIYIFSLLGVVLGFVLYLFKISIFCFLIAVIESTIAKLRIFKLPDLLFTSFVISFIAIFLIF